MSEIYNAPLYIKHPENAEFASPHLGNNPAPVVDDWFLEELAVIFGFDYFDDPQIDVAWGQDCLRMKAGVVGQEFWLQQWPDGDDEVYEVGTPRFMIREKYNDPRDTGIHSWNEKLQGPKPVRGLYKGILCVQTPDGGFRYPDRQVLRELAAMDWLTRHSSEHFFARQAREQRVIEDVTMRKEKRRQSIKDNIKTRMKERARRLFHHLPNEGRRPDPYLESKRQRERATKLIIAS